MNLVIREAHKDDIPVIINLIKELALYEKLSDEVIADEQLLNQNLFVKKYAYVLIAEYDKIPVGYALYFFNFSTFVGKPGIYLEDIFVKSEYRGKGIGKELFNELKFLAKEKNCGRIEWSVLKWNKPSIDFYLSLGAKPMDDWSVFRLKEELF